MVTPPSATMTCPVMNAAASYSMPVYGEARKVFIPHGHFRYAEFGVRVEMFTFFKKETNRRLVTVSGLSMPTMPLKMY